MSAQTFSEYVKVPQLKDILEGSDECEQKLERIKSLMDGSKKEEGDAERGGSGLKLVQPSLGGTLGGDEQVKESGGDRYEKVLEKLSGVDRKTALSILESIDRDPNISWNKENFELILNGENIQFSDIRLLVKKIVTTSGLSLPVSLTLFIEYLIKIKLPKNLFRSGDSLQIRDNLLRISGSNPEVGGEKAKESSETENGEEISAVSNSGGENSGNADVAGTVTKRKRTESEDEETKDNSKRLRVSEIDLDKVRRSPRLQTRIKEVWNGRKNKTK